MRRPGPGPGLLVGIVVAASALATAATAADLPAPGPAPAYYPPAYRPVIYDWTGIYVGGDVGGGWMNDVVTTSTTTALMPAGTMTKITASGVVGGGQVGFNIQFSPVVIGFEGTWNASNLSGTQVTPSPLIGGTSESSTSAAHWYATATGRVGFALNDFLFYAKGGAAWMRSDYTQAVTAAGGVITLQTLTDTRSGYTAGGGVEFGLTENLSAKLEYDYLGFGTKSYNFTNLSVILTGAAPPPTPLGPMPVSIKSFSQMVTVGLNYRFNWAGGGTLVTK
jgi:outer membrane immunogenic protein